MVLYLLPFNLNLELRYAECLWLTRLGFQFSNPMAAETSCVSSKLPMKLTASIGCLGKLERRNGTCLLVSNQVGLRWDKATLKRQDHVKLCKAKGKSTYRT